MTQLSLPLRLPDRPRMRPSEPIVRSALVEGPHRWWLKRAWGPGPAIGWVGLNPSTADGARDDPTMLAEMGFSFRWGYGSLIKVNLYPLITPYPADLRAWLRRWRDWRDKSNYTDQAGKTADALGRNEMVAAEELSRCDVVVAAWGDGADAGDVYEFIGAIDNYHGILHDEEASPIQWRCLARTASGAPRHTLARGKHFIPRDAKPVEWWPP